MAATSREHYPEGLSGELASCVRSEGRRQSNDDRITVLRARNEIAISQGKSFRRRGKPVRSMIEVLSIAVPVKFGYNYTRIRSKTRY